MPRRPGETTRQIGNPEAGDATIPCSADAIGRRNPHLNALAGREAQGRTTIFSFAHVRSGTTGDRGAASRQFMDAARWTSALAVVVAHTCGMMMVDEIHAPDPGPLLQFMFAMKNIGHLAVVIFFVLSGYLVGGQELLRVSEGRSFDPTRYAIQRFSRIYTVFIPALVLTMVLDLIGQQLFNHAGLYTNPANGVGSLQYAVSGRGGLAVFLGNVLMLQTIAVEPFGGDGPLWSLANEWWYYVAFGLFLIAASVHQSPRRRAVAVVAFMLVLAMMPWTMIQLAFLWLIGVAAAVLGKCWRGLNPAPARMLLAAGLGVGLCCMSWRQLPLPLPTGLSDDGRLLTEVVPALTFAVALISVKNAPMRRGGRVHQRLANFSFSLYAVHFPILLFLGAMANSVFGLAWARPFDLACAATIVVMTALTCSLALGFAQLTERHTQVVRAALTSLVAGRWAASRQRVSAIVASTRRPAATRLAECSEPTSGG